jgi:hypothetical protein
MAQLPPDGDWLVQSEGSQVFVIHRYTEEKIVEFDVNDHDAVATAQGKIHESKRLNPEQKSFAHFWCGYFYAHLSVAGEKV